MDPKFRPCQRSGSPARTPREDDHGRVPIRMHISHRGEKRFMSLPVKVLLGKWNGDKRRVTGTHPDASEINALLSDLERTAFSVISRLERAGTPTAAQRITGETQGGARRGEKRAGGFPRVCPREGQRLQAARTDRDLSVLPHHLPQFHGVHRGHLRAGRNVLWRA
ncbi:Arm DNA-binding domain-containing protein [Salinibacter ruber]|uniref:Arm DNA-binding domain-containing protein n=1 Tax=Salinibacter ruber TaxID=146919 RepID=UPI00311AA157